MLETNQLAVAIDFHSMENILWKSMAAVNCLEFSFLGKISL